MKKKTILLLCSVLAISSCFIGCGNKTVSEPKTNDTKKEVSASNRRKGRSKRGIKQGF